MTCSFIKSQLLGILFPYCLFLAFFIYFMVNSTFRLFGFSILITAILNIFLALALTAHPQMDYIVITIQVCQGLSLVRIHLI